MRGDVDITKKAEDYETEKHDGEENEVGYGKDIAPHAPTKQWSQAKLKKEYRKFNLDLAPKVSFLRNLLVYVRQMASCAII